jgi:hypothetical protein
MPDRMVIRHTAPTVEPDSKGVFHTARKQQHQLASRNGRKQRPPPWASGIHQHERGVGAGDQQEDCGMITDPESVFGIWETTAVVERRSRTEKKSACWR